jgi:hypothetical protein
MFRNIRIMFMDIVPTRQGMRCFLFGDHPEVEHHDLGPLEYDRCTYCNEEMNVEYHGFKNEVRAMETTD